MQISLRVLLAAFVASAVTARGAEPNSGYAASPTSNDRFVQLMSDQPRPVPVSVGVVQGGLAPAPFVPITQPPVPAASSQPFAATAAPAFVPQMAYQPSAPAYYQNSAPAPAAAPALLGNMSAAVPVAGPFAGQYGAPQFDANIQLAAQQAAGSQQPSVVVVPERALPPTPSSAGPANAVQPAPTEPPPGAQQMTDPNVPTMTGPPPIDAQRYDNWIGPNYRSNHWAQGGCNYCPCYVRGEYLAWWFTNDQTPALVTTSPTGTPVLEAGVLGQPGTSVLFGDQSSGSSMKSGARITLGTWINPSARFELEWFGLGGNNTSFNANSSTTPILASPFFDITTGAQSAYLFSYPNASEGSISINEKSFFNGAGAHIMRDFTSNRTQSGGLYRFGGIYGFRYLGLYEKLSINASTDLSVGGSTTSDAFRTSNSFYGGNFGLFAERQSGRWTWDAIGRVAFGTTSQRANISGSSSELWPTSPAGLFAYPSNIGSYTHDLFTVLPQLELKLAFAIRQNLSLRVGYDLLYWGQVARPGHQIDTSINTTQLSGTTVGTPGPLFKFQESSLLIQGVSAGVELRY